MKRQAIRPVEAKKQKVDKKLKMTKEPKVPKYTGERSRHSESKTPPSKRKRTYTIVSKTKGGPSKMAKKGIRSASTSSPGTTQILEVMTKLLPINTLSPLGLDLTNLLLTMKGKDTLRIWLLIS
jgi:hypothetical protein